jgi:chaperonin GroEL
MLLRQGFEKGLKTALQALKNQSRPVTGKDNITRLALGMTQGDDDMARMLGEIFDIVGADGLIVVEKGNRAGIEREYIEGTYWHISGWFSRLFINDPAGKQAVYEDASLLISDLSIKDPAMLVPVLESCVKAGIKKLVIVAGDLSDTVIGLLEQNRKAKVIEVMVVRTPRLGEVQRVANMEDIAVLTGARPFYSASKSNFDDFNIADLGHARRAWATESLFGIFGGKGDIRQVRQRIVFVRNQIRQTEQDAEKALLQDRLGRLSGGSAILRVGGFTESEMKVREVVAKRAITGIRLAMQDGVVPGGGAGLLGCQVALLELTAETADEAYAYRILAHSFEEPMRVIAENAGFSADVIVEKIVDLSSAGIQDSTLVLNKALEVAITGAAMALTTDVIIHHSRPKESIEP